MVQKEKKLRKRTSTSRWNSVKKKRNPVGPRDGASPKWSSPLIDRTSFMRVMMLPGDSTDRRTIRNIKKSSRSPERGDKKKCEGRNKIRRRWWLTSCHRQAIIVRLYMVNFEPTWCYLVLNYSHKNEAGIFDDFFYDFYCIRTFYKCDVTSFIIAYLSVLTFTEQHWMTRIEHKR